MDKSDVLFATFLASGLAIKDLVDDYTVLVLFGAFMLLFFIQLREYEKINIESDSLTGGIFGADFVFFLLLALIIIFGPPGEWFIPMLLGITVLYVFTMRWMRGKEKHRK